MPILLPIPHQKHMILNLLQFDPDFTKADFLILHVNVNEKVSQALMNF